MVRDISHIEHAQNVPSKGRFGYRKWIGWFLSIVVAACAGVILAQIVLDVVTYKPPYDPCTVYCNGTIDKVPVRCSYMVSQPWHCDSVDK